MRYFLRPGPVNLTVDGHRVTLMPEWMIMGKMIDAGVDFDGLAIQCHHGTKDPGDWGEFI